MGSSKVYERRWLDNLQTFTANGGSDGTITVADTAGFFVKQEVSLTSATQPRATYQVKRVTSPTTLKVGSVSRSLDDFTDVSAFLLADGAQIYAAEQVRPSIDYVFVLRHVYQEEPAVALRVLQVDQYGSPIGGGGGVASDVNVIKWGGAATSLGQKDMAHSVPVVLASNQPALPVLLSLDPVVPQFNVVNGVNIIGNTPATAVTLLTATVDRKIFTLRNTLNRRVRITLNGAPWLALENNMGASFDFASNGKKLVAGDVVGAYYETIKPSGGNLALTLI